MSDKADFSDRLRELVTSTGLTQYNFAHTLGIAPPTLSAYLKGQKKPSLDTLVKIAEQYKVSIDWLCGLAEEPKNEREVKTYSDVIKRLVNIEQAGIEYLSIAVSGRWQTPDLDSGNEDIPAQSEITIDDYFICKFFKEWMKMKELHDTNTIDDNLYFLWMNQQLEKYNFDVLSKDFQIMEIYNCSEEYY